VDASQPDLYAMIIVVWNVRGVLKDAARNNYNRLRRKYNPDLIFLYKTHVGYERWE